jgi:hypothetical protein
MNLDSEDPFTGLVRQFLPFLFSLLDDALIMGLSRLGCKIPWLESLSPIIIVGTALYLTIQFCQHGLPKLITIGRNIQSITAENP